jgi:hypothetical protein
MDSQTSEAGGQGGRPLLGGTRGPLRAKRASGRHEKPAVELLSAPGERDATSAGS